MVLVEDLDDFAADTVIARGEVAAEEGRLLLDLPPWKHEERFRRSVRVPRPLAAGDFAVDAGSRAGPVTANVIGVIENHAATHGLTATLEVRDGLVQPDPAQDVLPLALVERHHGTGRVVNAFVQGFGFDAECGVATTVAHDCHHLLVTGTCGTNMAEAANALVDAGGGVAVVRDGAVIALVELPIGGLMSDEPAGVVAEKSAPGDAGAHRVRLRPQQRLHAAQPAGAGRDPRAAHLRPRPGRRLPLHPHPGDPIALVPNWGHDARPDSTGECLRTGVSFVVPD